MAKKKKAVKPVTDLSRVHTSAEIGQKIGLGVKALSSIWGPRLAELNPPLARKAHGAWLFAEEAIDFLKDRPKPGPKSNH